jgi:hypothetical protein
MPTMDDGPTDGPPGKHLKTAWVHLTVAQAYEVLESLKYWAVEIEEGTSQPGWHMHVTDADGSELTIAIGEPTAADVDRESDEKAT